MKIEIDLDKDLKKEEKVMIEEEMSRLNYDLKEYIIFSLKIMAGLNASKKLETMLNELYAQPKLLALFRQHIDLMFLPLDDEKALNEYKQRWAE
ncbi:MAG: hypothetical protein JSV25_08035 [Spirochaetota bacterium]|nr:MAG: hypothetical protein JSV25_08035 [Spirochaetota bacterium]